MKRKTSMDFRHGSRDEPEINLIPFIDVLLVILIFLMLSTTYSKFTEMQLRLPVADADAQRDYPKEIIVSVSSDGRYMINKTALPERSVDAVAAALATIASAAPLLGLLGTVIGMIEIFGSQSPAGGAVGSGNPAQLAHGISIALYNTAFGLIVAIPTLIFWRYFRSRVDEYLLNLELASERFARHLEMLRG